MELKSLSGRVALEATDTFNRTAYGIEILKEGTLSGARRSFNRTAYGIEIRNTFVRVIQNLYF